MRLLFLTFLTGALFAQQPDSPVVTSSLGLPALSYQNIFVYSSSNLTYRCVAPSNTGPSTLTITAASNANPVSFTYSGGFDYQSGATVTPAIYISGATAGWAGINGLWLATPTSSTTFTIPVNSTGFGTYTGQTPAFTTRSPLTTALVWAIEHLVYDGSNNLIWLGWAAPIARTAGPPGNTISGPTIGSPSFNFACASRTTYAYQ